MKVLMFSASQAFMLCCVRWPDMAVYMKVLMMTGSQTFMLCCVRWSDMPFI